jgi:hypothetical protein
MTATAEGMARVKLAREFEYFLAHRADLVARYSGRVVVIKGEDVLGAYANESEAVRETQKHHAIGTFLVQRCTPGDEAYTQTFHSSRVTFG